MQRATYGTWSSPITPESLTAGQARIDEVRIDGPDTWWLELRPWEGGRTALVRHDGHTGERHDVLAEPWNVRSRVHEYGGGAYAVGDGLLVFSDFATNRLYRVSTRERPTPYEPTAITPEMAVRFGGLVLHERHVYAVREDHRADGEPDNELVRLEVDGPDEDGGLVLATGSDFVSRPAVSPDGTEIAWIAWDHPNMPWDSTRLMVADLTHDGIEHPRVVAGGEGISVAQPAFSRDGTLWFVSDESGFWNLHRRDGGTTRAVHTLGADIAAPQWLLGFVDYALREDGTVLIRRWVGETAHLGVLDPATGDLVDVEDEGTMFDHLQAVGSDIAFRRLLSDRPPEVVRGPVDGGGREVVAVSSPTVPDPEYVSLPETWTWTNSSGEEVHGLLYRPRNPRFTAPEEELPPLLVNVHGGPTSRAEAAYAAMTQFWTTRGFAVLDVNHGGSTGYGRAYRERLRGQWGVVDIDDCVTGAASLADAGVVDGDRLAIHGGSAGGYTVLRALTTSDVFTAGTSSYGISDLRGLLSDDHKFESQYTIGLVASWPEGEDVYLERSPISHIDSLHGELLLLQGADDLVVPVSQAQQMADGMRAAGKEVELVVYEGEGHGFRMASTIIDSLERELAHYQRAFGLTGSASEGGDGSS
ncbi:MAG: LpqB family beta-propeller domain-containing protein [Intrasporangiaceae bacterium]|nr:LpqB family beta-propeller domain-containing protein [Intrasporangiaceae bacterium]